MCSADSGITSRLLALERQVNGMDDTLCVQQAAIYFLTAGGQGVPHAARGPQICRSTMLINQHHQIETVCSQEKPLKPRKQAHDHVTADIKTVQYESSQESCKGRFRIKIMFERYR